jgi:hypothetical protein
MNKGRAKGTYVDEIIHNQGARETQVGNEQLHGQYKKNTSSEM